MNSFHDSYAHQLFTLYSQTKGTFNRLNQKQSKYDKFLSAYYHEIEHKDITPSESYDYMIALQNILLKRRAVKQELYHLELILRSLQSGVDSLKQKRSLAIQRTTEYNRTLNVCVKIRDVL